MLLVCAGPCQLLTIVNTYTWIEETDPLLPVQKLGIGVRVASKPALEVTQVCCEEPRALQESPSPHSPSHGPQG